MNGCRHDELAVEVAEQIRWRLHCCSQLLCDQWWLARLNFIDAFHALLGGAAFSLQTFILAANVANVRQTLFGMLLGQMDALALAECAANRNDTDELASCGLNSTVLWIEAFFDWLCVTHLRQPVH